MFPYATISAFFEAEGDFLENRMAWFINEEGEVYEYNVLDQPRDFPGDYPVPFDTQEEAEIAAETTSDWLLDEVPC